MENYIKRIKLRNPDKLEEKKNSLCTDERKGRSIQLI